MNKKVNRTDVQEYYGKVLKTKADLKTSACCSAESIPDHIKRILSQVDDEIMQKFYGCGSPIPPALDGCTILDLGCGTGRDAFQKAFQGGRRSLSPLWSIRLCSGGRIGRHLYWRRVLLT